MKDKESCKIIAMLEYLNVYWRHNVWKILLRVRGHKRHLISSNLFSISSSYEIFSEITHPFSIIEKVALVPFKYSTSDLILAYSNVPSNFQINLQILLSQS